MTRLRSAILTLIISLFAVPSWCAELLSDDFDGYGSFSELVSVGDWSYTQASTQSLESTGCRSGKCVKISWTTGVNSNALNMAPDSPPSLIHVRFSFKQTGSLDYRSKFIKLFGVRSGDNYANATFGAGYGGPMNGIMSGDGAGTGNDATVVAEYDSPTYNRPGTVETFTDTIPQSGTWRTFEAIVKFNSDDAYDGYFRVWLDGVEWYHLTGIKIRHNTNVAGFEKVSFGNWAQSFTSDFDLWIDDVVVTNDTDYIGVPGAPPLATCYPDLDADLYPGAGSEIVTTCSAGWFESSHFVGMTTDCDDTDNAVNPSATETCGNAVDEDCSGVADTCPFAQAGLTLGGAGSAYLIPPVPMDYVLFGTRYVLFGLDFAEMTP